MAYVSVADIKTYAGISEATDDDLLSMLQDAAQQVIDDYTGRTFEASADTSRTFDTERDVHGLTLFLDKDLCAVTTVTNGDGTTITAAQYVTEPRNETPYYAIKIKASTGLYWDVDSNGDSEDAITVSGRWAYSTVAPYTIAQVCTRLTAYLYWQKDNAGELDRAVLAGNATILPAQIPADLRLMLDPYVRRVF